MQPKNKTAVDVKLLEPITLFGSVAQPGEVVTLPELSANALIREGKSVNTSQERTGEPQTDGKEKDDQTPHGEVEGGTGASGQQESGGELLAKALDAQYKRDDLATAAKDAGVDFAYDAKKAEIIQAAIDQEKAEALLKKE